MRASQCSLSGSSKEYRFFKTILDSRFQFRIYMNTSSAIIQIQQNACSQNCSVAELLRLAKTVAYKLDLQDFLKWIVCELDGYPDTGSVPGYRILHTRLMFRNPIHGWQPAQFSNPKMEKRYCEVSLPVSIHEIVEIENLDPGQMAIPCPGHLDIHLNDLFGTPTYLPFARFYAPSQIARIIQSVKDEVLDWALKLERQGIYGNNMIFTPEERDKAKSIQITVHNTGTIGAIGDMSSSQGMNVSNDVQVAQDDFDSLKTSLLRLGISEINIGELREAILEDKKIITEGIGSKVMGWLKTMGSTIRDATVLAQAKKYLLLYFGIDI